MISHHDAHHSVRHPVEKRTKIILSVFQYFYLVSAILILFAFVVSAFSGRTAVALLPSAIVAAFIAYGIYNKKSWTIIVVTLLAAFGIVNNLLSFPAEKFLSLIVIAILAFEVYFFNRKDIKALFGLKRSTFFF